MTARTRYNRWVSIGPAGVGRRTLAAARDCGLALIDASKPGMCCWYSFRFAGTPQQMAALEAWWDEQGIEWVRRQPRGAWPPHHGAIIPWSEVPA